MREAVSDARLCSAEVLRDTVLIVATNECHFLTSRTQFTKDNSNRKIRNDKPVDPKDSILSDHKKWLK